MSGTQNGEIIFAYDVFGYRTVSGNPTEIRHLARMGPEQVHRRQFRSNYQETISERVINGGNSVNVDRTRHYVYDAFGSLRSSNDRNLRTITYGYDNLGRRKREHWGDGSYQANYSYTIFGQLEEAKDFNAAGDNSEFDYLYNSLGRITNETQRLAPLHDSGDIQFVYQYDLVGNVTRLTADILGIYWNDFTNTYKYDNQDRVTEVRQAPYVQTGNRVISFDYQYQPSTPGGNKCLTTFMRYHDFAAAVPLAVSTKRNEDPSGVSLIQHYKGDLPPSATNEAATDAVTSNTIRKYTLNYNTRGLIVDQIASEYNASAPTTPSVTQVSREYDAFGQMLSMTTQMPGKNPETQRFPYDSAGNLNDGTEVAPYNRLIEDRNHAYEYDKEGNVSYRWSFGDSVPGVIVSGDKLGTGEHSWDAEPYRVFFDKLYFEHQSVLDKTKVYFAHGTVHFSDWWWDTVLGDFHTAIRWENRISKWVADTPLPLWFTPAAPQTDQLYIDFDVRASQSTESTILCYLPVVAEGSSFQVSRPNSIDEFTWDHRHRLTQVKRYEQASFEHEPCSPASTPVPVCYTTVRRLIHLHLPHDVPPDVYLRRIRSQNWGGAYRMESSEQFAPRGPLQLRLCLGAKPAGARLQGPRHLRSKSSFRSGHGPVARGDFRFRRKVRAPRSSGLDDRSLHPPRRFREGTRLRPVWQAVGGGRFQIQDARYCLRGLCLRLGHRPLLRRWPVVRTLDGSLYPGGGARRERLPPGGQQPDGSVVGAIRPACGHPQHRARIESPPWYEAAWEFVEHNPGRAAIEAVHVGLDVAGLIPGIGFVFDLANAGIYLVEGRGAEAAFSAFAAIPFVGYLAAGGQVTKYTYKLARAADIGLNLAQSTYYGIEGLQSGNNLQVAISAFGFGVNGRAIARGLHRAGHAATDASASLARTARRELAAAACFTAPHEVLVVEKNVCRSIAPRQPDGFQRRWDEEVPPRSPYRGPHGGWCLPAGVAEKAETNDDRVPAGSGPRVPGTRRWRQQLAGTPVSARSPVRRTSRQVLQSHRPLTEHVQTRLN